MGHYLPPAAKLSERLLREIEQAVRGFARYHKYTLGSDLRKQAMQVVRVCHRAWRDRARQTYWTDQEEGRAVSLTARLVRAQAASVAANSAIGFDSPEPKARKRPLSSRRFLFARSAAGASLQSMAGGAGAPQGAPVPSDRSVNPASSVASFDSVAADSIDRGSYAMCQPEVRPALNELESLHSCFSALADLISPDGDLQTRQRDHLAVLLDNLLTQQARAFAQLSAAAQRKTSC